MPPGFDNFDPSCTQKSYHILVPSLGSVPYKSLKMFGFTALKNTQDLVSVIPFQNSDIPTSQSVLKQTYTEDSSGQNNDDKVKKPIFGSHAITIVNYCNIFTFFHVTNNKVKAALTVLSIMAYCMP